MKKKIALVSIALIAFAATFAIAQSVTGENWVGYVQVDAPAPEEMTLLGVNFEAVGGGGSPLNELISTNSLVGGFRPSLRDQFYLWDEVNVQYKFYSYDAGTFYNDDGDEEVPTVYAGDALWLKSSPDAASDRKLQILGQVDIAPTSKVVNIEGFELCSNPYPVDMVFTNIDWLGQGATGSFRSSLSDQVYVFIDGSYQFYSLNADGNWEDDSGTEVSLEIPPGQGFWYRAQSQYTNEYIRPFGVE